jgi:hypothetical protein
LLFFPGKGQHPVDVGNAFELLRASGTDVMIVEYAGDQVGFQHDERCCYDAADAAYQYLTGPCGVPPSRVYVAGYSLGAAMAIDLAGRVPVAGLIAICAFTRMSSVAAYRLRIYPEWLIRLVLRYRFDNLAKIAAVRCPILIAHADCDEKVPLAMADALSSAAPGTVERFTICNSTHVSALCDSSLFQTIRRFIARHE